MEILKTMNTEINLVTPQECFESLTDKHDGLLIDVRERDEFFHVSSPLAKNFPISSFSPDDISLEVNGDKNAKIFVICLSGGRSYRASLILQNEGFTNIANVEGGMRAWETASFPVQRGV
jgi:rhodanese-related sulfurtransferase